MGYYSLLRKRVYDRADRHGRGGHGLVIVLWGFHPSPGKGIQAERCEAEIHNDGESESGWTFQTLSVGTGSPYRVNRSIYLLIEICGSRGLNPPPVLLEVNSSGAQVDSTQRVILNNCFRLHKQVTADQW